MFTQTLVPLGSLWATVLAAFVPLVLRPGAGTIRHFLPNLMQL